MKFILLLTIVCAIALADEPRWATEVETVERHGEEMWTGLVKDEEATEWEKEIPMQSFTEVRADIPSEKSLCHLVKIKSQGSCGSCWCMSLTNTLRSTLEANGKVLPELGWNYLMGCSGNGCGGGYFSNGKYLLSGPEGRGQKGVWKDSDFPYTARNVSCKQFPIVASAKGMIRLGAPGRKPSFKDIAYAVGVLNRTVSTDVSAGGQWSNYDDGDGIFNGSGGLGINHMVGVCEYNCEGPCDFENGKDGYLPNGRGWVTVYNSWGTGYGMKINGQGGFIRQRLHAAQHATTAYIYDVDQGPTPPPGPQVCGDGVIQAPEECDDGNLINGDGCNDKCEKETPPAPKPCYPVICWILKILTLGLWTPSFCTGC